MSQPRIHVNRCGPRLGPDPERVLLRRYYPLTDTIARRIIHNCSQYPEALMKKELARVIAQYTGRHKRDLHEAFKKRFAEVNKALNGGKWSFDSSDWEVWLGSFFMHEYSIETCALFNGSAVPHWDQSGLPPNTQRFILSLRACGEGHISSITFRVGTIDDTGRIMIERPCKLIEEPKTKNGVDFVFPDYCTDLSERVVFPVTPQQKNGVEDARFVLFKEDDGTTIYYGTYTAYDGKNIEPQMISTKDFKSVKFEPLRGAIENKGMALFPRRINGKYWMLSRQDDENILIMSSDNILEWTNPKIIVRPEQPWEQFKMGNCGSPIETPKGWLVLTHGVGSLRQYGIGLVLLDLNDPTKVIGRLKEPLISPTEAEREGYVPNVVYTCGGMLHGDLLMIPYAASDTYSTFATVSVKEVLAAMGVV